ncbi:MAG: S8 family serine peptidase, partial [Deltaproteobacteria bacterium]|nr:S8 family serine peptidase [Deltaproteobacteria bacterium]
MSKNVLSIISVIGLFAFLLFGHTGYATEKKYVEDELLVQFKAGVPHFKARTMVEKEGAQIARHVPQIRLMRIKAPPKALEAIKKVLEKNPNVAFVEPNYIAKPQYIPNDTYFSSQWHLSKIQAPEGWDISKGSENVIIAIADTGVNTNHPDLAPKLVPGYNCYAENTDVTDTHGHGTAVAGVAGAVCDNAQGVAGVACKNLIMPLKIANPNGYATYGDMAQAIVYAADNGAKIVNISFAGTGFSYTLQSAIDYAWGRGVIVVAAAGNSNSSTPMYPAALKNVIAVGGTAKDDTKASFSSYGDWVDISAPAVSIYTTSKSGGYGSSNGTSFASPIVAG